MSKDVIHHPPKGELEKKGDITSITIADINDGDEALKLVGLERTIQIDDEAYRRVRRKLVRCLDPSLRPVLITSRTLGHGHTSALCCGVLHTVSVRPFARDGYSTERHAEIRMY